MKDGIWHDYKWAGQRAGAGPLGLVGFLALRAFLEEWAFWPLAHVG